MHSKIKISRVPSQNNTPSKHDSITPAPSIRVKRTALQGAPVRRNKRTPQGDEEHPPSQDQENLPVSIQRPEKPGNIYLQRDDSIMKPDNNGRGIMIHVDDSIKKPENPIRNVIVQREERREPLAPTTGNTPRRPPPAPPMPPPPKMSVLETATAVAGASTAKQKRRRVHFTVNGKIYSQMGKIGKGGSSDVYRVMAENCKMFALKRVKLEGADESAVMGYKGEIDLLKQLEGNERVVQLYDYQVDEEKQCLSVVCLDLHALLFPGSTTNLEFSRS